MPGLGDMGDSVFGRGVLFDSRPKILMYVRCREAMTSLNARRRRDMSRQEGKSVEVLIASINAPFTDK